MRGTASTEGSFQNQEALKIFRISKLRKGTKKKVFGDPESSSEAGTQGPSSGVGGVGLGGGAGLTWEVERGPGYLAVSLDAAEQR